VLPNTLMTGSLRRKFVNIWLENMQTMVDIQQASGCFLEKYWAPEFECGSGRKLDKKF